MHREQPNFKSSQITLGEVIWECAISIYLAQGVIFFHFPSTYRTLLDRFALKTTSGFKLNATLRPLLSFFYSIFPFSLAQHATCCCFSPHVWGRGKRKRGQIPPRRVGGGGWKIKHRMMGAVIASQTTERIKNPLPSLACFIASSSSLDGIITLFVLRKRKLAAAIQTTVHPRGSIAPPWYGCALTQW